MFSPTAWGDKSTSSFSQVKTQSFLDEMPEWTDCLTEGLKTTLVFVVVMMLWLKVKSHSL